VSRGWKGRKGNEKEGDLEYSVGVSLIVLDGMLVAERR